MLSIGAMKRGQEEYYLAIARDDYYSEGGESPGAWLGCGAESLGLVGFVEARHLRNCFRGLSPGGAPLVQNANAGSRQPGWDLCFSAPKSGSVLWSQLSERDRSEVEAAHQEAVHATVRFLESRCAFSRIGKGGSDRVRVGVVVATFQHSVSRALEPQLHTHCLLLNLGVAEDGTVRALVSRPFYQNKMLAGAYYRCELSRQLQLRLGLDIERPLNRDGEELPWFEVKGIGSHVRKAFATRRSEIEEYLKVRGMSNAVSSAIAALATRRAKADLPARDQLFKEWQALGRSHGCDAHRLLKKPLVLTAEEAMGRCEAALSFATTRITFGQNSFTEAELLRKVLEQGQGRCLKSEDVACYVSERLHERARFVSLGTHAGVPLFTTPEVIDCEKLILASVAALRKRTFKGPSSELVDSTLKNGAGTKSSAYMLDEEQQAAVRYLVRGEESIKIISGIAGTGKTDILRVAYQILQNSGFDVIGAALAGVASRGLEEKTGIPSGTIAQRLKQFFPDSRTVLKHHAAQLMRAARGKRTYAMPKLQITSKSILVIDEASMIGTVQFARLLKAVVNGGGSVIAVGDERQLPAIERGGAFGALVKEIGGIPLTEVRRQRDAGDRKAVVELAVGCPLEALKYFARKGQVYVGSTCADAEAELLNKWSRNGGGRNPGDHRIFVATRAEVDRFNSACQQERLRLGAVSSSEFVVHETGVFRKGDRVRFNSSQRTLGIEKGISGTIVECRHFLSRKSVLVRIDQPRPKLGLKNSLEHHAKQLALAVIRKPTKRLREEKLVLVPLSSSGVVKRSGGYRGLALDYCLTTHLGQGVTVSNSYVMLGGQMTNRELAYVQMSRHRDRLLLFASQNEVGSELTSLAQSARSSSHIQLATPNATAAIPFLEKIRSSSQQEFAIKTMLRQQTATLQQLDNPHV